MIQISISEINRSLYGRAIGQIDQVSRRDEILKRTSVSPNWGALGHFVADLVKRRQARYSVAASACSNGRVDLLG